MKQLILSLIIFTLVACNNETKKTAQSNLTVTKNNKQQTKLVAPPPLTTVTPSPSKIDSTTQHNTNKVADTQNTVKTNARLASPNSRFIKFYSQFIAAVKTKNAQKFNALINTNLGVYIIESSGAMPKMYKVYDITNYKSANNTPFLSLNFKGIKQQPKKEALPKVICDRTAYDKQGCFYQKTNPLLKSRVWNYAGLNDKQIQAIEFFANTVKITVINTSNYTFYFSFSDNQWHIAFIDLRVPCSA